MPLFKCKVLGCGFAVEGSAPFVLAEHRRDAHPDLKRAYARQRAAYIESIDAEVGLLNTCAAAFEAAETDRDADARVLAYLASRWGPGAYDTEGVPTEAAPSD